MQVANFNYMSAQLGSACIQFQGRTAKGRDIAVSVPFAILDQLAEAMKYTDHFGHAVWHVQGKNPLPSATLHCSSCTRDHPDYNPVSL